MSLTQVLRGEASGAVKAVEDLQKAMKGAEKGAAGAAAASKQLSKEAQRIAEQAEPLEKYNRKMKELAGHVSAGRISLVTAQKAAMNYRASLEATSIAGTKAFVSLGSLQDNAKRLKEQMIQSTAVAQRQAMVAERSAARQAAALERVAAANRFAFGTAALSQIKNYVLGMASISGAVALVRSEIQAVREEEEKRTQAKLTVAEAEAALRRNIFAAGPSDRERLLAAGPEIAEATRLPVAPIFQALAGTFSATGGDVPLTLDLVKIAPQFTRKADEIATLAAGLGDIVTTGGLKDAEDALGFLTITQAGSRPTETAQVAKQVGKVLGAFTSPLAGSTPGEGAALFAATTIGAADPQGRLARTATIKLIDQTREFFEKNSRGFTESQVDEFTERRKILFADRKLAEEFLKTTKFQAATRGAIEKLFLGEGSTREAFESTLSKLADPEDRRAAAREGIAFVAEGSLQQTERLESGIASIAEGFRLETESDLSQERRKDIRALRAEATGETLVATGLADFLESGLTLSRDEALRTITDIVERRLGSVERSELTEKQLLAVDKLQEIAVVLTEIRDKKQPPTGRKE